MTFSFDPSDDGSNGKEIAQRLAEVTAGKPQAGDKAKKTANRTTMRKGTKYKARPRRERDPKK